MTDNERNKRPYYDYSKTRNQYFDRGQMEWDKNHFLQRILETLIEQQRKDHKMKTELKVNNGLHISLERCNNSIHTCCVYFTNLETGEKVNAKYFNDREKAIAYMKKFSKNTNQKEAKMPFTPADDKRIGTPVKEETHIEPDNDFHIQSYLDGKKVGKEEGSLKTDRFHRCDKIRGSLDTALRATEYLIAQKIKKNEWVHSYWYEMLVLLRKAHDLYFDKVHPDIIEKIPSQPTEPKGGAYVGINKKKGSESLS